MRDIKIIVAAHKPYRMPSDGMYLPVQVGASGKESIPGFMRDDTGDNISDKNPYYCELTGVYLAWKHVKADYVGLAHYRRHFRGKGKGARHAAANTNSAVFLVRFDGCGLRPVQGDVNHAARS